MITTFAKPNAIFISWTSEGATTIYRKTYEDTEWKLVGNSYNQQYEDKTVVYGIAYQYKTVSYPDPHNPVTEISKYCWCIDSTNSYGVIYDLYGCELNRTANSPLLMARIFDVATGELLNPSKVLNVTRSISLLMCNDVVNPPRTLNLKNEEKLDLTKSLTSNLILSPEWSIDNRGYNFRMTLMDEVIQPIGTYLITVYLTTTDTTLVLRWILESSL